MAWLPDLLTVFAVVLAAAYLLRGRRSGECSGCRPPKRGAETRISLAQLRQSARKGAGRH